LNIGPKGDGTVTEQEIEILNEIGEWMRIYGESIYGTTRSPYSSEPRWGFYTKKTGKLYAHVLYWPSNDLVKIPSLANPIKKICMLNDTTVALTYTDNMGYITISLPENAPNSINSVVMIDVDGIPVPSNLTGINDNSIQSFPEAPILEQNNPNPFNLVTTISFHLPTKSFVSLKIFDSLGRQVSTLLSKELLAGSYQQKWQALHLSSGLYFCNLQVGSFTKTKKLVLIK
jgi:hypothetical protein